MLYFSAAYRIEELKACGFILNTGIMLGGEGGVGLNEFLGLIGYRPAATALKVLQ